MCKPTTPTGHDGLKGSCVSCPFNDGLTLEASQAQDYGCLPTGHEVIQLKMSTGQNWACHDNENSVCKGLCHSAKHHNLDLTAGNLVRYSSWYHVGEAEAVEEARTGVLVQSVSGTIFETLTEGRRHNGGAFTEPKMEMPTLKYFYARTGLQAILHPNDTRTFLVASVAPPADTPNALRKCVGLIELEVSPYDSKVIWQKYITVAPEYQRQGIAKRMLALVVPHLRAAHATLERSTSSEEGERTIQRYVDNLLDAEGIPWTQRGRSEGISCITTLDLLEPAPAH